MCTKMFHAYEMENALTFISFPIHVKKVKTF